ncbi:hypothetical protein A8C75_17955 [Marinobacterium aestuarii]|uniref:Uncharacterized protein n=1 Tax=Marinobacterium aestuarii TaxID=1821621 RepID=A0A1A9F2T2_9GAMM|nr:hypothetical protein A8C75_17955 [Marinobacterium aestuarii]
MSASLFTASQYREAFCQNRLWTQCVDLGQGLGRDRLERKPEIVGARSQGETKGDYSPTKVGSQR